MRVGESHQLTGGDICGCLNCGKLLDGCSAIDSDSRPSDGDATVCVYCGHIQMFEVFPGGMRLRAPTDAEMMALAGDSRVLAISRAIKEVWDKRATKRATNAAKKAG
jgi:hypothetical protein